MELTANLTVASGGWRLPIKEELISLVAAGRSPSIDPIAFPSAEQGSLWSPTPVRNSTRTAWKASFFAGVGGFAENTSVGTTIKVRCVR